VTAMRSMMPATICESVVSLSRPITLKIMRFKTITVNTEKVTMNRRQYGLTVPFLLRNSCARGFQAEANHEKKEQHS
jgi:hypothetical protein